MPDPSLHRKLFKRVLLFLPVSGALIGVFLPTSLSAHPPTFQAPVNYTDAGGVDVTIADVTGDNILDLITVNGTLSGSNGFRVLPGNGSGGIGDGTFGSPQNYTAGFGPGIAAGQWGLVTGDLNNDLSQDVAIANRLTDNVSVAINNGSGFEAADNYPLFVNSSPRAVTTGYFNNDNVLDLAVADWGHLGDHTTDHWISVLLGDVNNPGSFLSEVRYDAVYQNNPNGVTPADIIAADFDGDGKTDLATANTGNDNIDIFVGNGDGTFQTGAHYGYYSLPPACISDIRLDAGDLNGDTLPDLVVVCSSGWSNLIKVLLNQGSGAFPPYQSPLIKLFSTAPYPRDVKLADFNSDGNLDMSVTSYGTGGGGAGTMSVFEGNGDGTFKTRVDYPTGSGITYTEAVAVADLNGDLETDIVVANYGTSTVSVFINNTVIEPPPPTLGSISPTTCAVGSHSCILSVTGADFVGDSVINFNGIPLATTYSSPTELEAAIPESYLASPGSFPITVFTDTPGGGTSNPINLTVLNVVPALSVSGIITFLLLLLLGSFVLLIKDS